MCEDRWLIARDTTAEFTLSLPPIFSKIVQYQLETSNLYDIVWFDGMWNVRGYGLFVNGGFVGAFQVCQVRC